MITRLVLENFKRYRGRHEIAFREGLNLIQGHNDAGKSSIFHAISYALFNQTPSLGSATYPLVSVGESRMRVTLEFLSPNTGALFRLIRYRSASKSSSSSGFRLQRYDPSAGWLTILSSETGSKERDLRLKLTEILGIDKRLFFNVIYSEQKEFVRLIRGGTDVRRTLDAVLGLSAISAAKKCINEILRDLRNKLQRLVDLKSRVNELKEFEDKFLKEVKKISDDIVNLEREYKKLMGKLNSLEKDKKFVDSLKALLNRVRDLSINLERLDAKLSHANEEFNYLIKPWGSLSALQSTIMKIKEELKEQENEHLNINNEISNLEEKRATILRKVGYIEDTLSIRVKVSKRAKCPTCGQPIDPNTIRREIERLEFERSKLRKELSDLENQRKLFEKKLKELEKVREEKLSILHKYMQNMESIQRQLRLINRIKDEKTRLMDELSKALSKMKDDLRRYANMYLPQASLKLEDIHDVDNIEPLISEIYERIWRDYSSVKAALESTTAKIRSLLSQRNSLINNINDIRERLKRYEKELQGLERIEQAIEDLKTVEECFTKLESELRGKILRIIASKTYFWYKQLVSDPIYVSVEIDPDTYELKAQPLGFPEPQPVKGFSGGGHETIFALAFRLALAEMTGFGGFLMFDEPTDATDSANRDAIIEALYKASRKFRQILLITHHGIGREVSAHVVHVSFDKGKNSSRIEIIGP